MNDDRGDYPCIHCDDWVTHTCPECLEDVCEECSDEITRECLAHKEQAHGGSMNDIKEFLVWPEYGQRSLARLFQAQSAEAAVRLMFYREHDNLNTLSFDDDGYSQVYYVAERRSDHVQTVRAVFVVEVQTTILPKE